MAEILMEINDNVALQRKFLQEICSLHKVKSPYRLY